MLVLSDHKMNKSLHLPLRILKDYRGALTAFGYIFRADGLNNTSLSEGHVLGTAPTVGMVGRVYLSRAAEGLQSL